MDYGKFRYEASKKVQEARKKTRGGQMKEIKLRPNTQDHDLGFKVKNLKKFFGQKTPGESQRLFPWSGDGVYESR